MDASALPTLLAIAWLTPLASFTVIVLLGKSLGPHGKYAGYISVGAILVSTVMSLVALFGAWLPNHPLADASHHGASYEAGAHGSSSPNAHSGDSHADGRAADAHAADAHAADEAHESEKPAYYGDWYALGQWGKLKLTIGYYIDALTVTMFSMVSLIAACVHVYALGYMHDELHDPYVDHEVHVHDGGHLHRPGRFHRFFQYLSLFSFSMLGLVIAGNVAMVFVFWELVGICSYFLIGFYIERQSASNAANKAFITNRVGDFGMLIGMMALWASLGTFAFGDLTTPDGQTELGIFSRLRTAENDHRLVPPPEMVAEGERTFASTETTGDGGSNAGHWLLFIAGVGIFCGCVGKSAQFPLHVWLPDAMEGPTPVSALVHSATMVAAGVYLVGRFYPAFSPEALLVIAVVGCITLTIAATIAITAVDIKRVLAYSTVSQLGYMMLSLGLGGWAAGLFHLVTHAFFKSLLFLCSGSVIHAVHSNDMREMGGLRRKMPITAYTMLVGCLAIIGAGIPLTAFGLSGYYSKDAIVEQAWSFAETNKGAYWLLLAMPVVGAAMTAFYMFRLWYMTFAGKPRNHHRYDHAHESPAVMTRPLLLLAFFAIAVGWTVPLTNLSVTNLLHQAEPAGIAATSHGVLLPSLTVPAEALSHAPEIKFKAGLAAFGAAMTGLLAATVIYLWNTLNPAEIRQTFQPVYRLLWNKWYFDELYSAALIRPTMALGRRIAAFDRAVIDELIHGLAWLSRGVSKVFGVLFDQTVVDGTVNTFADWTWDFGLLLRRLQTGSVRQYVLFIVAGTLVLFVAVSTVQWLAYS
ncbi:MAG: NADH-quinone oxidoreductase subunit L [Planctomycetota bacterium]|nr:MAG: NADH-quinone oxidoreductase subunit L [Planctomycetota bacterium]